MLFDNVVYLFSPSVYLEHFFDYFKQDTTSKKELSQFQPLLNTCFDILSQNDVHELSENYCTC